MIFLNFFNKFLKIIIPQGIVNKNKKTQIVPTGCCLGKPYLSPIQFESKNLLKCSPIKK